MSLEAYWRRFGPCDMCGANLMVPCTDLRYARRSGEFFTDRAHRGRPPLVVSPTTPDTCPTCGSDWSEELLPGCSDDDAIPDAWHSDLGADR